MRNKYKVNGDEAVILLERRNGNHLETIIDTEDLERLKQIDCKWYAQPTRNPSQYYVQSGKCVCCQKRRYLHRFIKNAPKGMVVDHINRNTLDNRKENLEVVTNAENLLRGIKRSRSSKSMDLSPGGIHWHKYNKRWIARIRNRGKRVWIGSFKTKPEAKEALENYISKNS